MSTKVVTKTTVIDLLTSIKSQVDKSLADMDAKRYLTVVTELEGLSYTIEQMIESNQSR